MGSIEIGSTRRSGLRALPAMLGRLARAGGRANAVLWQWHCRTQQRRTLKMLDDRMLRDIGVSRAEAEREASKPCWRP